MALLRLTNRLYVTIVFLQFTGKSMGPSNRRYKIHVCIDALIVRSIHIEQTSNVRSVNYNVLDTEFRRLRTQ